MRHVTFIKHISTINIIKTINMLTIIKITNIIVKWHCYIKICTKICVILYTHDNVRGVI